MDNKRNNVGPKKTFNKKPNFKFKKNVNTKTNNLFTHVFKPTRTASTNAGGKVIGFSAFAIVGDKQGSVGIGLGKGNVTNVAVEEAKTLAQKNMVKLNLHHLESIPHNIELKYRGTKIILRKGNKGHIANNTAKTLFQAVGLKNMVAKILGARSLKNTAYGIMEALKKIESPAMIAERRNMTLKDLITRKQNVIAYGLMRQNKTKNNEK